MVILFIRIRSDLVELRRAQRYRQNLLSAVQDGQLQDIDPFADPHLLEPDVTDKDLNWIVAAALGVILVKMIVVAVFATTFLASLQAR
jgi:hypothetical protein